MAEVAYNSGKLAAVQGRLNAGSTVLRAVVITGTKTGASDPDLATMAAIDAVTGVGLGTERVSIASVTAAADNANDRVNIGAATFNFAAAAGVTALALVIYDATTDTNDTTRIPVGFFDTNFGSGIPMDGGLQVTVPTQLFRVT